MSLSVPTNPPTINPSTTRGVSSGMTLGAQIARTQVNLIHGTTVNNAIGTGIPKQVTDLKVSVANAQTGLTCTVTLLFKRDSTDAAFSGINIWIKGYQGNTQFLQVASGTESPCSFVLNNTGETVSFTVQAFGNGGNSALSQSPTTSAILPKSVGGGFGVTTVVSPPTQLVGDVTTSGNKSPLSAKVVGIEGTPVSPATPHTGDTFIFNQFGDSKWDVAAGQRLVYLWGDSAGLFQAWSGLAPHGIAGTQTAVNPTTTEGFGIRRTSSNTASTSVAVAICQGEGAASSGAYTFGTTRRYTARILFDQSTNVRYWWGLLNGGLNDFSNNATFATDTPARVIAGFRFSAGTDAHIQAVCSTGASQTVVDTGSAIDNSASHLFDVINAGSSFIFLIDGSSVATISTNIPVASNNLTWSLTADNKNTANAVSFVFQWSILLLK